MIETILRRTAITCAALMLCGMLGDRTTWIKVGGRGQSMTDGAVYNSIASLSSIIALIALTIALKTRPRLVISLFGVLVATAAFGLSIVVSGLGVWVRAQGKIWAYSGGMFAEDMGTKWRVYPADGPYVFTFLATLGALASLGLSNTWLRDTQVTHGTRREPSQPVRGTGDA